MGTAKMVIPVSDLGWEEEETRVVEDAPMPSLAVPPAHNLTMRLDKVDDALLARARTSLPPKKKTSLPPKKVSLPAKKLALTTSSAPPKKLSVPAAKARPLPPRPAMRSNASATPKPANDASSSASKSPLAPRPLAVKPFVNRPFAIPSPLPRARPGLPTAVAAQSSAEVPSLFATDLEATSPFAAKLPAPRPAPPRAFVESFPTLLSDPPPPSSFGGATMPAPPPSMTGAIIIDEKMFEEALGGRIHMNGASLIPSNIDLGDVLQPTGTIDVDEAWLEDEDVVENDLEPESFWLRGPKR